jgi:GTP cyclohydrolase I
MEVKFTMSKIDKDQVTSAILTILEYLGEDVKREGLVDTPTRMIKSWEKLFGGYNQKAEDVLTTFSEGKCDEMILLKDIEFYSHCEHHFLPFFGKCHIAYVPSKKIVGVSKLARIVEIYSRRLQIQERMTSQIADCIEKNLEANGVMVVVEASHHCMKSRGVEKQNSIMVTSAIRGSFKNSEVRQEFLNLIKG